MEELKYNLRPYQKELVEKLQAAWWSGKRRLLMQLPTAGGKTVIIAALANLCAKKGKGVLLLAHREELLLQAKEKIEEVTGRSAGLIKAGYTPKPEALIQIASVQSLIRRKIYPNARLLITDEAHHARAKSYTTIVEQFPNALILGVTATPTRSDGQGFDDLYEELILGPTVRKLIDDKYLCPPRLFATPKRVNTSGVNVVDGEYNQRELVEAIDTSLVSGDMVEAWDQYANNKKTVVFCIDVNHSKLLTLAFQSADIPAEHIDGSTLPEHRSAILERFRTGKTLVLCNCNIITEGFDLASIEAVQCVRPTKSLSLWLQMVGRGLRPAPGKDYCIIIDHTENFKFHGLPDKEHEWSLAPKSLTNTDYVLECKECHHVFIPLKHEVKLRVCICPACKIQIILPPAQTPKDKEERPDKIWHGDPNIKLVEIIDQPRVQYVTKLVTELKAKQEKRAYKVGWIYLRFKELCPDITLEDLKVYAKVMNYREKWADYTWEELQEEEKS